MKISKAFILMVIAFILVVLLSPFVFIIGLFIYRKNLADYFYTIAIGLDQLGGSILYNEEDWTVSSWTYYLCQQDNKYACWFMKFIDFIFGEKHCKRAFNNEINLSKKYAKLAERGIT